MVILEFYSRPDNGPRNVGPFPDRAAADAHATRVIGAGTGSWAVVPLTSPDADLLVSV